MESDKPSPWRQPSIHPRPARIIPKAVFVSTGQRKARTTRRGPKAEARADQARTTRKKTLPEPATATTRTIAVMRTVPTFAIV